MNTIPQSRLIIYLLLIGLIPVFLALANFYSQNNEVEKLYNMLMGVEQQAFTREKKQSLNMTVREHFKNSDPLYIDKYLETQTFLEPETETLEKLINNRFFAGDENVKKRLEYLKGKENKILFTEGNIENTPFFKEITASLVHPVEVNLEDLQELLSIVDNKQIGSFTPPPNSPQIIVLDFKIENKEVTENNETFLLNMKLLKREYQ